MSGDKVGNEWVLECRRVLNPKGKYVLMGGGGPNDSRWIGPMAKPLKAYLLSRLVSQDMGMMFAALNKQDLTVLSDLMQAGKVKPVIDRRYSFREIPEAIGYLEKGHARGKVVITLEENDRTSPLSAPLAASSGSAFGPGLIVLALIAVVIVVPV